LLTQKTESRSNKIAVGIVGCGAIGSSLATAIEKEFQKKAHLVGLSDLVRERAVRLSRRLKGHPPVLEMDDLVRHSDLVIETAHASIVPTLLKKVIQKGKNLFVMSSGGLLGQERLLQKARQAGCQVSVPSGALFGMDGIKAASFLPIQKAILITRKPPQSFEGAPFVLRHRISLRGLRREKLLFRGNVKEAVKAFPQNINVAATLVLSGLPPQKFEVRIIADPKARRNSHEVTLHGPLGTLCAYAENVPSRTNPKTSRLAIFSALATLKALFDPVRVGT